MRWLLIVSCLSMLAGSATARSHLAQTCCQLSNDRVQFLDELIFECCCNFIGSTVAIVICIDQHGFAFFRSYATRFFVRAKDALSWKI